MVGGVSKGLDNQGWGCVGLLSLSDAKAPSSRGQLFPVSRHLLA